jgi:hypothetical protein
MDYGAVCFRQWRNHRKLITKAVRNAARFE